MLSSHSSTSVLTASPAPAAPESAPNAVPQFASVRHMVFGPLAALEDTIKTLHKRGYAAANDWSQPQPVNAAGEYVTVLIRRLKLRKSS
ncbi:MAG: hypothetical protein F6J97_15315 [Leptolyngbya sp. SIO4C1]|nr:hypothetical protein [Leptolyngbya sp. SIO4C1]